MYKRIATFSLMFFAAAAQAESPSGGVVEPQPSSSWIQESGKSSGGESQFQCPGSQVMIGRQHQGDENGQTRYQCATVAFNGAPVEFGTASWSSWLQESGKNSGGQSEYVCPANMVMVGRRHKGDENGNTRYGCAPVKYKGQPLALRTQAWNGPFQESGKNSGGSSSYTCPTRQVMIGRRHQGDENGNTWYLCGKVSWDQTPLLPSPPNQSAWMQESGKNSGGKSSFVCPSNYVMTARAHKGDENGNTMYQCEQALYHGEPAQTVNPVWGAWIQESGKYTGGTSSYSCPASRVMTGRQHQGDENGTTRYQCSSLFVKGYLAQIAPVDWEPWQQESGKKTRGESYFACGTGTFMVRREHKGDENGDTRYQCAAALAPFNSATLASVYGFAAKKVNDPALSERDRVASRADMGLGDDYFLHVDVRGEGYQIYEGGHFGFGGAININERTFQSQPPYSRIPSHIYVESVFTSPYPFKNGSANYVTLQSPKLEDSAVPEFARILAPGGQVGLWIDMEKSKSGVQHLAQLLQSEWKYSCSSGQQPCSNTCIDEYYDAGDAGYAYPKICIADRRRS